MGSVSPHEDLTIKEMYQRTLSPLNGLTYQNLDECIDHHHIGYSLRKIYANLSWALSVA
jgi:hypothetical protein